MSLLPRRKWCALLAALIASLLLLSGCATVPPQQITGATPTHTATIPPQDVQDINPSETIAPINSGASASPVSISPLPQTPGAAPQRVELFYSGMFSMMGFADAFQTTIYENAMDALPACVSLLWPQASVSYYRYGPDMAKSDMQLAKDVLLGQIRNPSFYLEEAMTKNPDRVKREGEAVLTAAENMNEPISSFYTAANVPTPSVKSGASGTPVAVAASGEDALTVIVTDLHELRTDDGALLDALNANGLAKGRAIGVAAIMSEFSGYIPGIGENDTDFVWGDPPSGTLDYMLDYTDYRVGISLDPEQRKMASRPFYVLVIGEQSAVNAYLEALSDRLSREFSSNATFQLKTAVFGSGYVPSDYSLGGNMTLLSGQGVTAIPDASAPGGVALIELKASQQARFLEWEVSYKIHPADPRGLSIAPEDFTFFTEAVSQTDSNNRTVLPHLTWDIVGASGDTITLKMRLDLPASILQKGAYTLELSGSLAAPAVLPGSDWLGQFGYDADGSLLFDMEQGAVAFDGGKTLFLSRLIDTLGKANLGRLGVAPLGTVRISLTVYA